MKTAPHSGITRREAITRLGGPLLALGLGAGCRTAEADSHFQFIAVNDLHHASPECGPYFTALIRQMKTHEGARFALVIGDLADDGKSANLLAVRTHFENLGLPFYPVPGNHDYTTATDRTAYETAFPGRVNYRFDHGGWQFLGIDSTQGTEYEKTRISAATLAWLDATLPKLDRHRPTVLFTHFPLGETVPMRPLNADEVLQRFAGFNLQGVFDGHHHAYTLRQFNAADVVTNRCCSRLRNNHDGTKEKGYWLVTAAGGRLMREFIEFKPTQVP